MGNRLVIVESPAKARTIAGYLGPDFVVESSVGHIRDLPQRASEVPKAERARFGTLGVDVDHDFEPYYVESADKKKKLTELKRHLKDADELLLATDEDREGEAIAWHLLEVLKPKVPVRRMVFHEITREAIEQRARATRARSTSGSSTRRRRGGSSTGSTATRCRRCSGGRSPRASRPAACSRSRCGSSSSASASGSRSCAADVLGHRRPTFDPGAFQARLASLGGRASRQGRDFGPDGAAAGRRRSSGSTSDAARALVERLDGRDVRRQRRRARSRTRAGRPRRS